MLIDVDDNTFNESLGREGPVLLVFKASWCGPCKALAPHIEKIAAENQGLRIVRVDIDKAPQAAKNNRVMAVPAVFLVNMRGGRATSSRAVESSPTAIRNALRSVALG